MIKTYIGITSFPATSKVDPCSPSPCGPFSNCLVRDTKAECSCMNTYQVSCDWSPVGILSCDWLLHDCLPGHPTTLQARSRPLFP